MDCYKKALLILERQTKPLTRYNQLIELAVKTEDVEFEALLRASAKIYRYYLGIGKSRPIKEEYIGIIPRNHGECLKMLNKANSALRQYIETVLAQEKPEWQLIAQQHGWKPAM